MSGYETFKKVPESSTPQFHLSGRKPLHPEDPLSPITNTQYNERSKESTNEFLSESIESEHSSRDKKKDSSQSHSYDSESSFNRTPKRYSRSIEQHSEETENGNMAYLIGVVVVVISALFLAVSSNSETALKISIQDIQKHFPLQSEEIWNALETGIYEVKNLNKPSVFLFLYDEEAESTINNILSNASMYAECILNENCEIQPIELTSSSLNTEKALEDYGHIISKYKPELERRTVMIVKDLDKVSGEVAQAFHSMCDEYTPLVEKTVFFFTMKIENLKDLEQHNVNIAEEILRSNWSNLDEDVFEPLFTRISSMVLRIVPENVIAPENV